jgi:battenin
VLLANIIPGMLVKVTGPFWLHLLSYRVRCWINTLLTMVSFVVVSQFEDSAVLKLLGVCVSSFACGMGEVSLLSYTSFFHPKVVQAWSSGTGLAGVAGAGFYVLMRDARGLSPKTTVLMGVFFPIFYIAAFMWLVELPKEDMQAASVLLSTAHEDEIFDATRSINNTHSSSLNGQQHQGLLDEDATDSDGLLAGYQRAADSTDAERGMDAALQGKGRPSRSAIKSMGFLQRFKMAAALRLHEYMIPLFMVYFFEYLINTGVNPAIDFPDMKRTQFYTAAGLTYQCGVFLSRSSRGCLPISKLWPMGTLQMVNLAFFILQAYTDVVPSAWLMLLVVLWVGFLGGAGYVNTYAEATKRVPSEYREFAIGVISIADSIGIVLAATCSLTLECMIMEHRYGSCDPDDS